MNKTFKMVLMLFVVITTIVLAKSMSKEEPRGLDKNLYDYYGKIYIDDCMGPELDKDKLYECSRKWECIENTEPVSLAVEAEHLIRNNQGRIDSNKSYFEEINRLNKYKCDKQEEL